MRRLLAGPLLLLAASAFAQTNVVNIQEVDEDGNQIALTFKDSQYADNNGVFTVQIFSR